MKQEAFAQVLKAVEGGGASSILFQAEGKEYLRKWRPRERLIILGGGHIALPLCTIGSLLGFSVVVADDRPSFANRIRFPQADQVCCGEFCQMINNLQVKREDYVCILTRGHRYDGQCLRSLLNGTMPAYLGMIGSRRRTEVMKKELWAEGYDQERIQQLCAPIGLPIGARTTGEIAVAIGAQLVEYREKIRKAQSEEGCLIQTDTDLKLLAALAEGGGRLAAALVIETRGSSPVKTGALMAVDQLGICAGTVGGGCGEAQVTAEARKAAGKPVQKIIEISMTGEEAEEEGMVCGGTMKVLIEGVLP